jgi:DNA-binding response OmpR family regulator
MIDHAKALGADAYVTKPVAIEELDAAMQKAFTVRGTNQWLFNK